MEAKLASSPFWQSRARQSLVVGTGCCNLAALLKLPALPPYRLGVALRLPDRLRHEVDDGGLALQGAADAREREGLDGAAEAFVDVAPQDDVDEAGLVFKDLAT